MLRYQCPELVNRLYRTKGWISATWTGNGNQMFDTAPPALTKERQGSITSLNVGDVVVFNTSFFGGYGHVAVVGSVSSAGGVLYSQNTSTGPTWSYSRSGGTLTDPAIATASQITGVVHRPGGAPTPTAPKEGQQLLANGGFESGWSPWKRLNRTGATNRSVVSNPAVAHGGSSYVVANSSQSGGSIGQDVSVAVSPGRFITFDVEIVDGPFAGQHGSSQLSGWTPEFVGDTETINGIVFEPAALDFAQG